MSLAIAWVGYALVAAIIGIVLAVIGKAKRRIVPCRERPERIRMQTRRSGR